MSALGGLVAGQSAGDSFEKLCAAADRGTLEAMAEELEILRRESDNFYHRVRATLFLAALYRYFLPPHFPSDRGGRIPYGGHELALERRFEEAISVYRGELAVAGSSDALSSALAVAYYSRAFQMLARQVQRTVRQVPGNQWMFRMGHALDYPLRLRAELLRKLPDGSHPVLHEATAVRLDLSHAAWSDIFFLGMDYPEGAKVLNLSVNLAVRGRDAQPSPPVSAALRVLDRPVLRLVSVDLGVATEISELAEIFDFARDYLGLLKAAVIASGLIPPGLENSGQDLAQILERLCGPGRGLEIASHVHDIPKGSRLAVSTNLLGCLIALCMRATGQTRSLEGSLDESERRTVAGRAILGEWLGGSGGGWQDSGGVWPGIKLIEGEVAREGDFEFGTSRGRLLPRHTPLDESRISNSTREDLQNSLILVHGGMSQNVGPILEMVTEKYLLGLEAEAAARQDALRILGRIVGALEEGDVGQVAALTTDNFFGPILSIVPWAGNAYTEALVHGARQVLGKRFRGFLMLGGMSGGGMGFWVDPAEREKSADQLLELMIRTKRRFEEALPFAMDPVIYDFQINENGSHARLGGSGLMPDAYYLMMLPRWLRQDPRLLDEGTRWEMDHFAREKLGPGAPLASEVVRRIFPQPGSVGAEGAGEGIAGLLARLGFDSVQHERIREDLRAGRIGLAQNRLPVTTTISDAGEGDVEPAGALASVNLRRRAAGLAALSAGRLAVVTLAAGAGSRWTQGAGTVKALHPFAKLAGRHRSFLETHLAKSRRTAREAGCTPVHIFTTSYLTHDPTRRFLEAHEYFQYPGSVILSEGRSVGLRMIPTVRDLRFAFEETPHQQLDPQKEKNRRSLHNALMAWAAGCGEASDYTDNLPLQCLHPVGHWYEVANLLLNGTLARVLASDPAPDTLLLHNIDTLGASADPDIFGAFLESGADLGIEVITRRIEDRGGGLARVNGQLRLVEGLAMAREEDEFGLRYYNSATYWIRIDALLHWFGLDRTSLADPVKVREGVRGLAARMPTYITLKDVRKRWGNGQEDIFPVSQFERLWGDMTALPEIRARYFHVPRIRGQQLKDQAQLDGWLRDGSAAEITRLCDL